MIPSDIPAAAMWRQNTADKAAILVDGADYFKAAKQAMLDARHSIFLIGWDFDARTELERDEKTLEGPTQVGEFLDWLARRRPELTIRLLKWDLGLLHALGRGETSLLMLKWRRLNNLEMRLDSEHPAAAAHHMKLVAIDDAIAFCGGIDMTIGRWDTAEHLERDPRRRAPRGKHLDPWHDATTCITGPIAKDLGDLARERWRRATGETLAPPPKAEAKWPERVKPDFSQVQMSIARTRGRHNDDAQICEIEALTLHLIKSARQTLYIENQYLASRKIAYALADRLGQQDGPEIVLVMPETADGWLEAKAMDSARSRLLDVLRKADTHDRFRAYFPVNAAGTPIYVHAKIMIVDDMFLKIGSANFNNRSMGYDTESDVVIDAQRSENPKATAKTIIDMRTRLLAEHLGVGTDAIVGAIETHGGLIGAIEALSPSKPGLRGVVAQPLKPGEEMIAESDLVDPERPKSFKHRLRALLPGG